MRLPFSSFNLHFFILFVIFFLALLGYSKDHDTIAILPFSGQGIEENELYLIETALHNDINKSTDFQAFERTRMIQLLENNGITETRTCNEIACAILMGNMLLTKFITQCRIGKIEQSYTINLRIIDVKNKEVIKEIAEYYSGSISDFLKNIVPKITGIIVKTKLSDRKFIVNGKKEEYIKRDLSTAQPQTPQKNIKTENKSKQLDKDRDDDFIYVEWDRDGKRDQTILNSEPIELPDPEETPGTVKTPKKVDLPKKVDTPRTVEDPEIVENPRFTEVPKIIEEPRVIEEPKIVKNPVGVDAPRIVEDPVKVETPTIVGNPRAVADYKTDEISRTEEISETLKILKTEEIPEKIIMSTDDITSSSEKETPRIYVNKGMDPGIVDQKNRKKLRFIPMDDLKPEEIRRMILDNDFFCTNSDVSDRWSNPDSRYTTNHLVVLTGDKILIDSTTQLMWQSEGSLQRLRYSQISQYVFDINTSYFGGFSDWRLPTLEEAMSIVNSKKNRGLFISDKFSSTQSVIWTADKIDIEYSIIVRFDKGQCNYGSTLHHPRYVRLVRSF